jgi:putative ABC transport system permease protein
MVVISKYLNERVFGGRNSVGRSLVIDGRSYRVMGVLGAWLPQPRFYDLNGAGLDLPEDVYMPFGWGRALKMQSTGSLSCNQKARVTSFDSVFTEECLWLQYWVELPNAEARERYSAFVDSYVRDEKAHGRFPRPLNNRIASVATWLDMHDVVGEDSRMQLALAVMFLAVCILNTLGLVLAKFLSAAPISGLRRALGATRVDVIRQHLTEMVLVGALGGAAGLLLTLGGLAVLRGLLFRPLLAASNNPATVTLAQSLVHMDVTMLTAAVVVSVLTGVLAGLYPAWRIGRLAPNTFLKAQ